MKNLLRTSTKQILILSFTSLFLSNTVFAGGFQLYELGTPIVGTAAVGQAAVANDASISYFNPAGMTQLSGSQFMLGSVMLLPDTHFSVGSSNTIPGNNGNDAGILTPIIGSYFVYSFSQPLKFGISLTSPYGGDLNYADGWVGRYEVQQTQFYALDLNPAMAYQVNNWFSLGVGATLEYANLNQTVALPLSLDPVVDGQANIKVHSYAPGYNVGILLTPSNCTKIGITYRSRITHNLSGTTTFLRIPNMPTTTTKLIMPQNMIASLSQSVSDKFILLAELGWADWSSMKSSVVVIDGFSVATSLDWRDTYRVGLGLQYKVNPLLTLQAGASYDSSPTDASHRTPDLPVDKQIRGGLGATLQVNPAVDLGFSYEYINFGRAPIDTTSFVGRLQGSYGRNYANTVQMSVNGVF